MRRLESRKWIYSSESFSDYAMDKLVLTKKLQFSEFDAIHSLIDGITNLSIQAAAFALDAQSLDIFLEKMHRMTTSCDTQLKKITASAKSIKNKNNSVRTDNSKELKESSGRSSPTQKKEAFCTYCRNKGHIKTECFKLKKKEASGKNTHALTSPVAAVKDASEETKETSTSVVAFVTESCEIVVHDDHILNVCEINGKSCKLFASIDSGSPVSFVRKSVYEKFLDPSVTPLNISSFI